MKLISIFEARKNSEQNIKKSINEQIYETLENTKDIVCGIPNLFASFTALEKIGINPRSTYNTPIGIYAYPVNYIKHKVGKKPLYLLPFAGDQQYVNVFKIKGNIVDLANMTKEELASLTEQLTKLCERYEIPSTFIKHWLKQAFNDEETKQLPGGHFWYVTMKLASKLTTRLGGKSVVWNKVFRDLKIDGCYDSGIGIIHPSEPTQLVLFHIGALYNNSRYNNKNYAIPEVIDLLKQTINVEYALSILNKYGLNYINHAPERLLLRILKKYPDLISNVNYPDARLQSIIGYDNINNLLYIKNDQISPYVLADCIERNASSINTSLVSQICDKYIKHKMPPFVACALIDVNYKFASILKDEIFISNDILKYIKDAAVENNDLEFYEKHFT